MWIQAAEDSPVKAHAGSICHHRPHEGCPATSTDLADVLFLHTNGSCDATYSLLVGCDRTGDLPRCLCCKHSPGEHTELRMDTVLGTGLTGS